MSRSAEAVAGDHQGADPDPISGLKSVARPDPKNRGHQWLVAIAAALIVIGGFAGAYLLFSGSDSSRVATTPDDRSGFDGWGPGWHEVDLGPVAEVSVRALAWFKGRLIAVGGSANQGTNDAYGWKGGAWSFDPSTRKWSTIPVPDLAGASLVVAGDRLVALGANPDQDLGAAPTATEIHWATWEGGSSAWVDRGKVPVNPAAAVIGGLRLQRPTSQILVWTGEKVLDFAHGAALDPESGQLSSIEFPKGVLTYPYLDGTYPVWTGKEVVWPSPGISADAPGLAWGPEGRDVRELPAPPKVRYAERPSNSGEGLAVFARDGAVYLVAVDGTAEPYVQRLDVETGTWKKLEGPDPLVDPACFDISGTTAAGDFIFIPCDGGGDAAAMVMRGTRWFDTSPFPASLPVASEFPTMAMSEAGSSMVLWSTRPSEADGSPPPWAAVWVPEPTSELTPSRRRPRAQGETATTVAGAESEIPEPLTAGTPACKAALSEMPDVREYLPSEFETASRPGMGGVSATEGDSVVGQYACSRFWAVGGSPEMHVTQGLGSAPFGGPELGSAGSYTWSAIEDGWKIEYGGSDPWYLLIYAMDADGVAALARSLSEGSP